MFSIRRIAERGPEGEQLGEITIGDFTEKFACAPPPSEELGWKMQLQALLRGEPAVALVHDPRFAWVVYREGNRCFIQQRFFADSDFHNLLPRRTETEDGHKISEWSTTIEDIRSYVQA